MIYTLYAYIKCKSPAVGNNYGKSLKPPRVNQQQRSLLYLVVYAL